MKKAKTSKTGSTTRSKAAAKTKAVKPAARAAATKKPATVKSAKAAKPAAKPAAKAPARAAAKPAAKTPAKAAARTTAAAARKKPEAKPAKAAAPAKVAAKAAAQKPAAAKPAAKTMPVRPMAVSAPPSRPLPQPVKPAAAEPKQPSQPIKVVPLKPVPAKVKMDFAAGDHVVYPTHGVGKILRIERQMIAGFELELMVVEFERDKMTVRVPLSKVNSVGIRKLSSPQKMKSALDTLKGRARVKRAMWSRRAQEYEAKINSGDPVSIAEVVRDLHRNAGQPDQSYSERQIYESALDRLMRELAAVERIDEDSATKKLEKILKVA
ncbi:CarD family transcriptional regulator [Ferrovibrio sp.]|uniref:CarD family transcriptional regulator n=2 Tax=Ferrovibrio sp. TaxID=1917215 RepID=UPI00351449BB